MVRFDQLIPDRLRTLPVRVAAWWRVVHTPDYLAAKGAYLGGFATVASFITACFVAATWVWDYAIDPANMPETFQLRLLEALAVLGLAAMMTRRHTGTGIRIALFVVPAFVQITFIEVLSRLDQGVAFGMGGFLYFFIFVPFMAQAQSLRFNIGLLAFLAALPNALVLAGLGGPLPLPIYNAYVWMVYPPIVLILAALEYLVFQVHTQHTVLRGDADTDFLTGLGNRRDFLQRGRRLLEECRFRGEPLGVLFVDLDGFKAINDTYGHACGDAILQQVAQRLRSATRAVDINARIGGEEFVVLLPDTDAASARITGERIREAIAAQPFDGGAVASRQLAVTVSIGTATAGAGEMDLTLESLAERADGALYAAKRQGRNRVVAAELSTPSTVQQPSQAS